MCSRGVRCGVCVCVCVYADEKGFAAFAQVVEGIEVPCQPCPSAHTLTHPVRFTSPPRLRSKQFILGGSQGVIFAIKINKIGVVGEREGRQIDWATWGLTGGRPAQCGVHRAT